MDKVSVIVCVYNGEKTIKRCLDSIINQSYNNIDIVIINDGSNDNTLGILNGYKDKRIRIINQTNHGLSYSRNVGIDNSIGKYIIFVDADDKISKYLIEECIKYIDNNDLVMFSYQENHKLLKIKKRISKKLPNDKNISEYGYAWNKMYKKKIIKRNKIRFDKNIQLVEDLNFNKQYLKHTKKIYFIDKILYYYYRNDKNVLSKKYYSNFLNLIEISIKDKMDILDNNSDYEKHLYLFLIRQYIINFIRNKQVPEIENIYNKYKDKVEGIEELSFTEKYLLFMLNHKYYNFLYSSIKVLVFMYDHI